MVLIVRGILGKHKFGKVRRLAWWLAASATCVTNKSEYWCKLRTAWWTVNALRPGPLTYYYPPMGPTLPPPPLVYWGYPTPPVSPAHYYHQPHHPQTMMSEVVSVGAGSPLPIPPPTACPEWPIFIVN